MDDKIINKICNEVIELTNKEAIVFKALRKKNSIFNSKLGGAFYWPENMLYPLDEEEEFKGQPLRFFAQINFEELPKLKGFPSKGILQFFISCNKGDTLGNNLENPSKGESFRVVYHKDVDYLLKENVKVANLKFNDNFPFKGEYALVGKLNKSIINFNDYKFDEIFLKICRKYIQTDAESFYDIEGIDSEKIEKIFSSKCLAIGGNPNLLQGDIRYREEFKDYSKVLFTIPSVSYDDFKISFGDAGVANFLIKEKDLRKLDFSNVLYYWECY